MFKFVVLCAFVAAASAANNFRGPAHNNFGGQRAVVSAATSDDVHAEVKSFANDVRADGFQYAYDTTNGIAAAGSGDAAGNAHGNFGWISPEGVNVAVQYVADENGYQPSGDALPTPPPIPAAILKALEYIRTHPPQEEHAKPFGKRF